MSILNHAVDKMSPATWLQEESEDVTCRTIRRPIEPRIMARPSPLARNIHWQPTSSTKEAQARICMIFNVFTLTLTTSTGSNRIGIFIAERLPRAMPER